MGGRKDGRGANTTTSETSLGATELPEYTYHSHSRQVAGGQQRYTSYNEDGSEHAGIKAKCQWRPEYNHSGPDLNTIELSAAPSAHTSGKPRENSYAIPTMMEMAASTLA